jgi:Pentapeptide repeats (9 copies)
MYKLVLLALVIFGAISANAQINADEIVGKINRGESISYQNVQIIGDLDLTRLVNVKNDSQYPEKGKTALVYSNIISQALVFKNVTFKGKLNFFRKDETPKNINEYRVVFDNDVTFENCIFEQDVDFELTNFNRQVSFAGSIFKTQPRLVRVGLQKKPNIEGLVLADKCLFQFTQNDPQILLAVNELAILLTKIF